LQKSSNWVIVSVMQGYSSGSILYFYCDPQVLWRHTKYCVSAGVTCSSCSGSSGFKSQSGCHLSWVLRGFPQFLQANGWNLALGHIRFRMSPSQRLKNSSCHHDLWNG